VKNVKRIPLWGALLIDLCCLLVSAALLTGYFVFLPVTAVGTQLSNDLPFAEFSLPISGENVEERLQELVLSQKKGEAKRQVIKVFADSEKQMVITKNELGEGAKKITWYTADLYVVSADVIRTNVSVDETNEIKNQSVKGQAEDVGALFAITGDTFSMSKDGVIVRNGYLYRADLRTSNDICVLSASGELTIVEKRDYKTLEDIVAMGAWQVWTFGPSLLNDNGTPKSKFNIAASHLSDLSYEHPRTAIGSDKPGHYVFVLVDGRNEGYSKGATFPELAEIMVNEGCTVAYNLDGGRSAVMAGLENGRIVHINEPYKNGRGISDIIYVSAKEGDSEHE
jgi:exopolysaccharide biosynthesis protein